MFFKKLFFLVFVGVIGLYLRTAIADDACGVNSIVVAGQCKECSEINSDTPFASGNECIACDLPNQYVDTLGKCSECPDGNYVTTDNWCEPCPMGYYCVATVATKCSKGYVSKYVGQTSCTKCPNGTYSNEARTECLICSGDGKYIDDGECKICGDGYYIDNGKCIICPAGNYCVSGTKQLCESGKISTKGMAMCVSCPENTPYTNVEHTQCIACGKGNCIDSDDECKPCPAGYFCPLDYDSNTISCNNKTPCPIGSYSAAGQDSCTLCESGYTTEEAGTALTGQYTVNDLCKPIKVKLDGVELSDCLIPGKINTSVVDFTENN